jgi:hypothetical protein
LEQMLARGGSKVEWCASFCVDNSESRQRGIAESRWRTRAEVRAHGGGIVWRHGGIIGMILTLKIARRFDGGDDICSMHMRYSLSVR